MFWSLAWKNIWRYRARTLVVIFATASGLWGGLLAAGFMQGISGQMVKSAIETRLSDVQVHRLGFTKNRDVRLTLSGQDLLPDLRRQPGVRAVSGRVILESMASSSKGASGVTIQGVDPGEETQVTTIAERLVTGAFLAPGSRTPVVVVGEKLARRHGLALGSKLVLGFQSRAGELTGSLFRVGGIFRTESSQFDESNVFVRRDEIQRLAGLGADIHEVALRVTAGANAKAVADALRVVHPGVDAQAWFEVAPELQSISDVSGQMMGIFIGVIVIALLFGIVNTVLMSVVERSREIGMLMAVGMSRRRVLMMVVLESTAMSFVGVLLGVLAGATSVAAFARKGLDLTMFATGLANYGIAQIARPVLPWTLYAALAVSVVLAAALSAFFPAKRAVRLDPAVVLRAD
jgi:putative ABC transport system permease protein